MRQINPAVKAFAVLTAALITAFSFSVRGMLLLIGFCLLSMLFSRVKISTMIKALLPATIAAATLGISIYKSSDPSVVIQAGYSMGGLIANSAMERALAVSLRIYAYVSLGMTFALTTDNLDFIYSLMQQCRVAPKYAYGVLAAFNLIPQIRRQLGQIRLSCRIRGYRVSMFSPKVLFAAMVNAVRWSESLAMAMESKGFEETSERTFAREMRVHAADFVWAGALIIAALCGPLFL